MKIRCLVFGHKWRRPKFKSLRHSITREKFICLKCGKNKPAPATFYTPMDLPPTQSQSTKQERTDYEQPKPR